MKTIHRTAEQEKKGFATWQTFPGGENWFQCRLRQGESGLSVMAARGISVKKGKKKGKKNGMDCPKKASFAPSGLLLKKQ